MMILIKLISILILCIELSFGQIEKSSVVFVIDDTASMGEDIHEVKTGANLIFEMVVNSNDSQVEDFIIVTFNDPDEGGHEPEFLTKTSNPKEFKRKLSLINIDGGGDCEEMALSGIELGLEKSPPGSYIYVFTDATAKDHYNVERVQNMAIQKNTQIVFVLTGDVCEVRETNSMYKVYFQLADATSGQVFHMNKNDVGEILDYIAETIRNRKTMITAKKFPPGYGNTVTFPVDPDMEVLLFAGGGKDVDVSFVAPDGSTPEIKSVVDNSNVKAGKVTCKILGNYTAQVGSKSDTSLVVSAETKILFQHGFSPDEPNSIKDTSPMPIAGESTHLSIQLVTNESVTLYRVELLALNGEVIMDLPLKILDHTQNLYVTGKFLLPDTLFKISIKGIHVKTNTNIIRTSNTAMEVQKVDPRTIKGMSPTVVIGQGLGIKVKPGDSVKLVCKVKGYPRPNITWTDQNGQELSAEVLTAKLPYDYVAILHTEKVSKETLYTCKARNKYSDASQNIDVKIDGYLIIIEKPKDTYIEYKKEETISFKIDSSPAAEISWYKEDEKIENNDHFAISSDGTSLTVMEMRPEYDGAYHIKVENSFNSTALHFNMVTIAVDPVLTIKEGSKILATFDDPVNARCDIVGYPKPDVVWKEKDTDTIISTLTIPSTNPSFDYENILNIKKAKKNCTYVCEAKNKNGTSFSTEVEVKAIPYLNILDNLEDTSIEYKRSHQIYCKIDARPNAVITWYRNGDLLQSDEYIEIPDGSNVLTVKEMRPHLVGEYSCMAKNDFLSVETKFKLQISGTAPTTTVDVPSYIDAEYDQILILTCKVTGYPEPVILWRDETANEELSPALAEVSKPYDYGRVLQIEKVNKNATYRCIASNSLGNDSTVVTVQTVRIIHFDVLEEPQNITIQYEKNGAVYCKVDDHPPPKIIWFFGEKQLKNSEHFEISTDEATLKINNMQPNKSGYYICQAFNENDNSFLHFQVDISGLIAPVINKTQDSVIAVEGSRAQIYCGIIQGTPAPTFQWLFKPDDEDRFKIIEGVLETMQIDNVSQEHSGAYKCVAENAKSKDIYIVDLKVEFPPSILTPEERITANNGDKQMLKCMTRGVPKPTVTWYLNDVPIKPSKKYQIYRDNSLSFLASAKTNGQFKCTAINKHGTTNISTQVDFFVPVEIQVPEDTKLEKFIGDKETLQCAASGFPKPTIKWLFFRSGADASTLPRVLKPKGSSETLKLELKQLDQDGYYTCVASNGQISKNMTYTVVVNAPPQILRKSTIPTMAVEGDRIVRIPCVAVGRPEPLITWLKNGYNIASGSEWYDIASDGTLIIKNIDEGGSLVCHADNRFSSVNEIFTVVIEKYPKPTKPVSTFRAKLREPADVTCPIPHTKTDQLRWYKEEKLITTGELKLDPVSNRDAGVYTCRVGTFTGSQSSSVKLIPEE